MKKTMLLASLIAVSAMAAGTTGNVEVNFKTSSDFNTEFKPSSDNKKMESETKQKHTIKEAMASTEVKVKDSGFSFGGTFKVKDIPVFGQNEDDIKKTLPNMFDDTKAWAKYELPELKGINSYVKGTFEAKLAKENDKFVRFGNVKLEGDVNYVIKGVKVGLNSETTFPLIAVTDDFGTAVESTHKVYAEAKEVSVLKDVKANVKFTHTYDKITKGTKANEVLAKAVKNVSGEAEATYDKVKDLKLTGKVAFKANVADDKIEYKHDDEKLYGEEIGRYVHSYEAIATYTGVKNLELVANPFVAHVNIRNLKDKDGKVVRGDVAVYGVNAKAIYKMLDEKLTLTGKAKMAGSTLVVINQTEADTTKQKQTATKGHFVFGANAKYDHKVTDKFTVSPEFDATVKFGTVEAKKDEKVMPLVKPSTIDFTLTPKVSAEYKPVESLTIKGGLELPMNFGMIKNYEMGTNSTLEEKGNKFGYKSTSIKTSLNIKYTW